MQKYCGDYIELLCNMVLGSTHNLLFLTNKKFFSSENKLFTVVKIDIALKFGVLT